MRARSQLAAGVDEALVVEGVGGARHCQSHCSLQGGGVLAQVPAVCACVADDKQHCLQPPSSGWRHTERAGGGLERDDASNAIARGVWRAAKNKVATTSELAVG
jgi:hypothetical protein